MVKLIINADDLGYDNPRNDAILECFETKQISTATVMVNMPGFEDAVARVHTNNLQNCVGLHLNFTQGSPLTEEIKQFSIFCDSDGFFNASFHRSKFGRFFLSSKAKKAVYKEARAQMLRYIEAGFTMMHLDSHHHSHTDPVICKIVCPLAKELGFKSIRLSRNFKVVGFVKILYKWYVNRIIRQNACKTSEYFTDFNGVEKNWASLVEDNGVAEIMVHPNYIDADTEKCLRDYNDLWVSILDFLEKHKYEFQLMTFSELM